MRRKSKDFPFDLDKISPFGVNNNEEYRVGFGIEFLDGNGPVQIDNAASLRTYNSEDVLSLFKLKDGETGYIRWSIDRLEGIKTFQLNFCLAKGR